MSENPLPSRYLQPERIARGGMGEVYKAEDARLARVVAVKLLADRYADDESIRARFTREALAVARLSNAPHTIAIFDVGEHEGRPYIVMEYLPGGSLADRIAHEGAQPLGRSLEWLRQAAGALDAAHANGIVHRDVKPANLLLDNDGAIRVADFGVASATDLGSLTEVGTVVGTAGYLSPEQARGERATPASDLYALAVVAFELLAGSRPFERDTSTAEALAHVSAPIPPASALNPDLPREVDEVLARALAKRPEHRYGSATEFVHALRHALDVAAGKTWVGAPSAVRGHRRRPVPVLPLILGALLLAGVLAAALLARWGDVPARGAEAPAARTVRETVTLPGTTVRTVETVRTTAAPEPATAESPAALNDRGFALMRAGDFQSALPLLERAVSGLAGSGQTVEAYASYNLAFTRLALGSCDGVLGLLDRSQAVQGERKEITRLRREAQRMCG